MSNELKPVRYSFSYRNDFNDKYGADRDEDEDGDYVALSDVQEAIDFWNRCATSRAASGEVVTCLADVRLDVIARSYDWTIDQHGEVLGVTSGDMGYEATGIKFTGDTLAIWNDGVLKIDVPAEQSAPQVPQVDQSSCIAEPAKAECHFDGGKCGMGGYCNNCHLATQSASTVPVARRGSASTNPLISNGNQAQNKPIPASTAPGQGSHAEIYPNHTPDCNGLGIQSYEAEAERDAARYRWLRANSSTGKALLSMGDIEFEPRSASVVRFPIVEGETLDAAIDVEIDRIAALSKEKQG